MRRKKRTCPQNALTNKRDSELPPSIDYMFCAWDVWNNTKEGCCCTTFVEKSEEKNTKSEHGTWNVNFDFKMPENERIWIWHTDQMWIEFTTITANSIFCEYTDIQSMLNKIIPFCFWFNCKKLHSIKGLQIVCVFLYCVTNLSRMKW